MYEKIYGPYFKTGRYHLHLYLLDGKKKYLTFATEEEAEEIANPITVETAVRDYIAHRADLRPSSITTLKFRLGALTAGSGDEYLAAFAAERAWATLVKKNAVDTLHGIRSAAAGFYAWAIKLGYVKKNPLEGIEIVGRKRSGARDKEQLRLTEARVFLERALAVADGDRLPGRAGGQQEVAALGAATALLLGLRNGEIVQRTARDLDEEGTVLWVPESKTAAGIRRIEVPEVLQPHLRKLGEGKEPTAPLFTGLKREGLLYWTRKVCRAAKLPIATVHSLRRTHSTASIRPHGNPHEVAAALGHASPVVTFRHYVDPQAAADARQQAAASVLLSKSSKSSSKNFGPPLEE